MPFASKRGRNPVQLVIDLIGRETSWAVGNLWFCLPELRAESGHSHSEGTCGHHLRPPLKLRSVALGFRLLASVTASFLLQLLPHIDYFLRSQRNLWLYLLALWSHSLPSPNPETVTLWSFASAAAAGLALGMDCRWSPTFKLVLGGKSCPPREFFFPSQNHLWACDRRGSSPRSAFWGRLENRVWRPLQMFQKSCPQAILPSTVRGMEAESCFPVLAADISEEFWGSTETGFVLRCRPVVMGIRRAKGRGWSALEAGLLTVPTPAFALSRLEVHFDQNSQHALVL